MIGSNEPEVSTCGRKSAGCRECNLSGRVIPTKQISMACLQMTCKRYQCANDGKGAGHACMAGKVDV